MLIVETCRPTTLASLLGVSGPLDSSNPINWYTIGYPAADTGGTRDNVFLPSSPLYAEPHSLVKLFARFDNSQNIKMSPALERT
jgi:hypothetical protein